MLVRLRIKLLAILCGFILVAAGCGGAGEGEPTAESTALNGETQVLGSISSVAGTSLTGWQVVLVDAVTEITKSASVSSSGVFTFNGVDTSRDYTVVLLSPTMRLTATLFQLIEDATIADYYKQYFNITNYILPQLVFDGQKIYFQNQEGLSFTSQLTLDQNLDGISDGISLAGSVPRFGLSSSMGTQDLDSDGILNTQDPDVDGDGVVNVFDTDDDNDGILDVFDVDSDGDLVEDHILESSDQYFSSGIEWFTVMYNNDEALNKKTLTILAKLREGANPASVQISGPSSLLDSAMVEYVDEDGNPVSQAFNGVLLDEGNDNDGSEGDLLYGRTLTLDSSSQVQINSVLFLQLVFGSTTSPYFLEYPYLFSLGAPGNISIAVTNHSNGADLALVSGSNNPFSGKSYLLSGQVFNDSSELVWSSVSGEYDPLSASTAAYTTVPTQISSSSTCEFQGIARSVDRIPGYSNYKVLSERFQGTCP